MPQIASELSSARGPQDGEATGTRTGSRGQTVRELSNRYDHTTPTCPCAGRTKFVCKCGPAARLKRFAYPEAGACAAVSRHSTATTASRPSTIRRCSRTTSCSGSDDKGAKTPRTATEKGERTAAAKERPKGDPQITQITQMRRTATAYDEEPNE